MATDVVPIKRARSDGQCGPHPDDTSNRSDSSKLDDVWRNFGRMFALVEQHSKDMQKHGNDLAELRERRFVRGHYIGHVSRSATALVMTVQGVQRGTGLSRLTESERWEAAGVAELKGLPWDWQWSELTDRTPTQALPAPLTLPVPPQRPTAGRTFYITRADLGRLNATQGP
eukprot:6463008-Amphidinium_carterae.1